MSEAELRNPHGEWTADSSHPWAMNRDEGLSDTRRSLPSLCGHTTRTEYRVGLSMGSKVPQPPTEAPLLPPFAVSPSYNHNPVRGQIAVVVTPPYGTDSPMCGLSFLTCARCGELMGRIGPVGSVASEHG